MATQSSVKPEPGNLFLGKTRVAVCRDEFELGRASAAAVGQAIRAALKEHGDARVTLAAGESQMTFLDALAREPGIDWQRVTCFSMDEFHDVRMPDRFSCGYQIERQLWEKVRPRAAHRIRFDASDAASEAARFERLVRETGRLDVLCQGIGTSGHLALNEPFNADFQDPEWVRVVSLGEQSKRQLIDDPNFKGLGYIPGKGITMTIPALISHRRIFTIVPLGLKRPILTRLFGLGEVTTSLPASILLETEGTLFVDRNSCPADRLPRDQA